MSIISEAPPSSSDESPSINNPSIQSKSKRTMRSLVAIFKAKHSIFKPESKPFDENNDHKAASSSATTNDNDKHNDGAPPSLSKLVDQNLIFLEAAHSEAQKYMDQVNVRIKQAREKFEELRTGGASDHTELDNLKKAIVKLKSQIPLQIKMHSTDPNINWNRWPDVNRDSDEMMDNTLYKVPKFEDASESERLLRAFDDLPEKLRQCLICFFWFPAMATIKKRVMIYLWMAESYKYWKIDEDIGNYIFDKLIAKGLIEPVYQKCSLVPDCCRMSLSVRSALAAKVPNYYEVFEDCTSNGVLIAGSKFSYLWLINVSAAIIDVKLEQLEKRRDSKILKILFLGRWQNSATHHIEVAGTKILHRLKNMGRLRVLSLRGISLITELPSSISELTSLRILDLRACHNLEEIPDGIGLLRNLTHLDMSECYFLENMPKSLANLTNLEVLKGFFIGDFKHNKGSCTLRDLSGLSKLRKLNIYTSTKDFPTDRHLSDLQKFEALKKLTISWGGCSLLDRQANDDAIESLATDIKHPGIKGHGNNKAFPTNEATSEPNDFLKRLLTIEWGKPPPALPSTLQKLDLQCFHGRNLPSWLRPANLKQLKKLYIRGGQLCDLGEFQNVNEEDKWTVEILCLKYLSELDMDWEGLKALFPKLIYLHQVECPKLTSFPFDESVGWINVEKGQPVQEMAS